MTDSTKAISQAKTVAGATTNYWIWVATAELLIIGYLCFKILSRNRKIIHDPLDEMLSDAKNSSVDMDDLMDNIYKSRLLYKKLSTSCHPDRFPADEEKRKIADELFQEISNHQRNYNKLVELQELAKLKLDISI